MGTAGPLCAPVRQIGDTCNRVGGPFCGTTNDLACIDGPCALPLNDGAPCNWPEDCASFSGSNGVCVP